MSETSFSQVNTAISVQEASFLTPQQYEQLLQADDPASRSAILQGTVYAMDAEAIKDLNAIEQVLMKHLYSVYNWALEMLEISHIHANLQDAHILIILVFLPGRKHLVQHEIWTILSRKGHDQVLQNLQRIGPHRHQQMLQGLTCRPTFKKNFEIVVGVAERENLHQLLTWTNIKRPIID